MTRDAPDAPLTFVLPGHERFATALGTHVERIAVGRFPNAEFHVELPRAVDGRHCRIVGSVAPPAGNLVRLTLVSHALCRAGARRVTAVLPYLAYARQDRAAPGQSLGLQWLGDQLRAGGVTDVVSVDVHSGQAARVMGLPVLSLSPATLLAAALPASWRGRVTFVAPDEGAIARCGAVADAHGDAAGVIWLRKQRTAAGIEHLGVVGTPTDRAIVVDDILDTGATLVSCVGELRRQGVQEVGIMTTHGLFTGDGWRPLLHDGLPMWITDTVLSRRRPAGVTVVPVAPLLADVLTGPSRRAGSAPGHDGFRAGATPRDAAPVPVHHR